MSFSRRDFLRLSAGTGALAAFGQLSRTSAFAAPNGSYRAMVGVFLFGGNDGWNMLVPTDSRYTAYVANRGAVALKEPALTPLSGVPYALHTSMSALAPIWDEGGMGLVLNAGTLFTPLDKATYQSRPDLRPSNLLSHTDEQAHWQGLRARAPSVDGFLGRIADRMATSTVPPLVSLGGAQLAVIGRQSEPLFLPSTGTISRLGFSDRTDAANAAKNGAITALADGAAYGMITDATARTMTRSYDLAATANGILTASSGVDSHFVNPVTGAALTSDISRQLLRVARVIEARGALGHARQAFFVSQGGYDNHAGQVTGTNNELGTHSNLLRDLAHALAAFYRAMQSLGMKDNVTTFTMSDFGRTYKGNAQIGSDHAWGNNHLVLGGGVTPRGIFGTYPDPTIGGDSDISQEGRFIPTISQEEYLGAIARWHGVADADLPYVFPNWATWSSGGRGPLALYGA